MTHTNSMRDSRRRLPHIYAAGRWLFVTWNLHGSVRPAQVAPPKEATAGEAFAWMDRQLDIARSGPLYLRRPEIAEVVVECLYRGVEMRRYELGAFAVMANHVHALILPRADPSMILKGLKGVTAREANRILGLTGHPFWQAESYDHWVRSTGERERIVRYIENNPVRAGFVARAEDYRWSSAWRRLGATGLTQLDGH